MDAMQSGRKWLDLRSQNEKQTTKIPRSEYAAAQDDQDSTFRVCCDAM